VLAVVVLGWSFYINPDLLTKTRAFLGDTLSDSKTTAAVLSAAQQEAALTRGRTPDRSCCGWRWPAL
jgi:hypothetical protein